MKVSSRWNVLAGVVVLVVSLVAAGTASARVSTQKASIQVCVLLPDTKSSARYELFDRPYLAKAFKAAGVAATINNAQATLRVQESHGSLGALVWSFEPVRRGRAAQRSSRAASRA